MPYSTSRYLLDAELKERLQTLLGYAHVSTGDQTLDLQTDALTADGCDQVVKDIISGAKAERSGLEGALSHVRSGDTLVVWHTMRYVALDPSPR